MEIKINFDTASVKDLMIMKALSCAMQVAISSLDQDATFVPSDGEKPEPTKSEEPASEPSKEAEPVVEEKPKRKSRKKAEPVVEEEPAPVADDELPFNVEDDPAPEPVVEEKPVKKAFPKMNLDEWAKLNQAKREELRLTREGEHANLRHAFNDYCFKNCELWFHMDKPSNLSEEELWRYGEWFKTIKLNEDYVPGSADSEHSCPFVSKSLSELF